MNNPSFRDEENDDAPLARRPVSDVSRFEDDEWELDRYNKSKQHSSRTIFWKAHFGKHGYFTDKKYAHLLHVCKLVVYSVRNGKATTGFLKGSSLVSLGRNLIAFVRWMIFHGFHKFSDLGAHDVLRYRTEVLNNPGRYDRKTGTYVRKPGAQPLHSRTVTIRMQAVRYLIDLKDIVGDVPDWDPLLDPGDELGSSVSKNHIPRIPDHIALPLYAEALRWVENHAGALIDLKDALYKTRRDLRTRGKVALYNATAGQIQTRVYFRRELILQG